MPNVSAVAQLPPPSRAAFLLDFDGTLVDIAPTPEAVVVADGLPATLLRLRVLCGDALGVVSGRPIAQIDRFLPAIPHAVAGEHGVAIRHAPAEAPERVPLPAMPAHWQAAASALADRHPGSGVEFKPTGLVLHYRGAPDAGPAMRAAAEDWLAEDGNGFHLQPAKMAWEIKPDGIDKASAVRALMARPPFAGRVPIFVGDDVTDEDGIRGAQALGGLGFRIPHDFATPGMFRDWLAALARTAPGADAWAV